MKNSNLITIQSIEFNDEIVKTVNARELHSYLQSKQDFSTWIKKRIKDYGFIENIDFVRFHKKMEANNATVIDYAITIDMAKELSMVERNQKGKQARQYFIESEKKAKQQLKFIRTDNSGLSEYRKAKAIDLLVKSAKECFSDMPNLSEKSKQVVYASLINPIIGSNVIPLPILMEKTYSATEVGKKLGISSQKVGKIANKLNLKTEKYGIIVLDKSPYSDKQVESFRYNQKAIELIQSELIH